MSRIFATTKSIRVLVSITLVLLAQDFHAETVRFAHCLGGCPTGAPADNQVISRAIYTLSFNTGHKVADWVAYIVTSGSIGVATNLSREPRIDPFVPDTLRPEDFAAGSEANQLQLNYFTPLVSFAGTPFWSDTNYLTNRVPRNSELNRGSWYGLEWAVRNLANRSDGLYVIAGPVYDEPSSSDSAGVPSEIGNGQTPDGFFKVIADQEGRAAAFFFPQDLPFYIHHCDQLTSVAEVEALTGLDLFPDLPALPSDDLSESLGCFR